MIITYEIEDFQKNFIKRELNKRDIKYKEETPNDISVLSLYKSEIEALLKVSENLYEDLLPVQFHYMLNKYGFDLAIAILLPPLRENDLERYALYKAYLEQARFYEYDKTYEMFLGLKNKFEEIDPTLGVDEIRFKKLWREAMRVI